MFCEKCGAKIDKYASFCPECGTPIAYSEDENGAEPQNHAHYEENVGQENSIDVPNDKRKFSMSSIIIIVLAIALIFAIGFILYSNGIIGNLGKKESMQTTSDNQADSYTEADYDIEVANVVPDKSIEDDKTESLNSNVSEKTESLNANESETTKVTEQVVDNRLSDEKEPFYGIWCSAAADIDDAQKIIEDLEQQGIIGEIFVTSEWSNLNAQKWYAVSVGTYSRESDAEKSLDFVKELGYPNAYIKYSGEYLGANN
jgi:hypothetical protein